MVKKLVFGVSGILLVALLIWGCGSSSSSSSSAPDTQSYAVVNGTVYNTSGTALSGVDVTASGSTAATNSEGWFSVQVTPSSAVSLTFTNDDYVTTYTVASIAAGASIYQEVHMVDAASSQSLSASTGGVITSETSTSLSGSVSFPANSLADADGDAYTGTASVTATFFDPTVTEEANAFPGNYEGLATTGAVVPIKSYGFTDIAVTDTSGNSLDIASGSNATITIPVPTDMQGDAPATIPLWYYDTTNGQWVSSGEATYNSSLDAYVGNINHLSYWNADYMYDQAYIVGTVVDGSANPIANAEVLAYFDGWQSTDWTASNGSFEVAVEPGVLFHYYARKSGQTTTTETISSVLTAGETRNVGNLVLSSPNIQITLTWGLNPADLDSHLTVPTAEGGSRYHLYYSSRYSTSSSAYPYAGLDTDDQSSYGPEVTSIYTLQEGTYRYCVHHYSGVSDIDSSPANVNLIISNGSAYDGIYNFSPPSGASGDDDVWRVFDIVINSSGAITAINTIDDYLNDVSADDADSFSPRGTKTMVFPDNPNLKGE